MQFPLDVQTFWKQIDSLCTDQVFAASDKFPQRTHCPSHDAFERVALVMPDFARDDLNIRQTQFQLRLSDEAGFLAAAVEQHELMFGMNHGQWQARQPSTSAKIQNPACIGWKKIGKHERIQEMPRHDFRQGASADQVIRSVPLRDKPTVSRQGLDL